MIHYDNSGIRRQDRILEQEDAFELLRKGEYGYLSLTGKSGAYGIPISYAWQEDCLYFHCAPEGEKLRRIEECNSACFCVVGKTAVQPALFTTGYESLLLFGKIAIVRDDDERMKGLELLVDKYSPDFKETGLKYAQKSLQRTTIFKLNIERMSGKSKKTAPHAE